MLFAQILRGQRTSTSIENWYRSPVSAITYIVTGQSNVLGYGDKTEIPANLAELEEPLNRVYLFNNNTNSFGQMDVDNIAAWAGSATDFGPSLNFAYQMRIALDAQGIDKDLYIVQYGRSGTGLYQDGSNVDFHPDSTGEAYDTLEAEIVAAKAAHIASGKVPFFPGVCWFQGENDSSSAVKAADYEDNLPLLQTALNTITRTNNVTLPAIKFGMWETTTTLAHAATVQAARVAHAAANDDAFVVPFNYTDIGDGIHLDTDGCLDAGADMAAQMATFII